MESPPSCSTWSEALILSDDSGLLSISSGSIDSKSGRHHLNLEQLNSDFEDSLDDMSDIICGENFNTLKKGPNWSEDTPKHNLPIDPPLEFQDKPMRLKLPPWIDKYVDNLVRGVINDAVKIVTANKCFYKVQVITKSYWASYSPCHNVQRPNSRNSLGSNRLSCSHNSLSVQSTFKADDSNFITQAVSHDTLTTNQISDFYNVPFDSDIYANPVDVVKPKLKPKLSDQIKKKRQKTPKNVKFNVQKCKRHSVPASANVNEPIHMTLQEVRQYLQTLYSSNSDSSTETHKKRKIHNNNTLNVNISDLTSKCEKDCALKNEINVTATRKSRKNDANFTENKQNVYEKSRKCPVRNFPSNLKHAICNLFKFGKFVNDSKSASKRSYENNIFGDDKTGSLASRALPPIPPEKTSPNVETSMDFASSIEKVKDYGWYWGPISSEAAEKILSNEPDGSFIVRDSSDHHYIFSLTFKLNNCVRHVRIEHDQGNFSFGSRTKFKSHTIIEFIENAVEHSRSGRYLFFLHRRPVVGPMRVQLLHPVSRFKQTQSLQHMCRFVILKLVRKDLITSLPLPYRIIEYLSTPHYYSEQLLESDDYDTNQQNATSDRQS